MVASFISNKTAKYIYDHNIGHYPFSELDVKDTSTHAAL